MNKNSYTELVAGLNEIKRRAMLFWDEYDSQLQGNTEITSTDIDEEGVTFHYTLDFWGRSESQFFVPAEWLESGDDYELEQILNHVKENRKK